MDSYHNLMVKVLDHFEHIKFDKSNAWHRLMVSLYCSVVENSDTLLVLQKKRKGVALPTVTRSLMEAFVDLKNLTNDKGYGYFLDVAYYKEWLRVTTAAKNPDNALLQELSQATEFEQQVKEWEEKLDALKAQGYIKLSQYKKFEKAEMIDEYASIYNFLCAHSHNNQRALIDRYLVPNEDKTDFTLKLFHEVDDDKLNQYLEIGQEYFRASSELIHKVLNTGREFEFQNT
ncbi:hypothetical protein ALT761_01876 [Alteromonas sp. 76-1]|jgi:hypothetical protein|uniref:DUF5677 domain-containing protein n=1 Tax=Alteromonas sp. 76-1 TaxID=2358187 RepID=UPI000FD16DD5|nr:DUF5677 domain-containing protein [Alteromonas sp. 76-1]VEL96883.1 hypothetical protein ALT761_01876 [Alteromonas sp. 76-1]